MTHITWDINLSAQCNETETKQSGNCFETVLKLFRFSFISLCGRFNAAKAHRVLRLLCSILMMKSCAF